MKKILICLLIVVLFSCKKDNNKLKEYSWEYIYITYDNSYSYLFDKHSNEYETFNISDSIKTIKNISKNEKDSLYKWIQSIVEKPPYTDNLCTGYVGNIKIIITRDERVKQTTEIKSVCDWSQLSNETKNLKAFLNN
ncbi:hypothetical protein SAMN05443634_1234 [Chishuiella changwenlii]|uniref:Lipoprotein n=2 Tax=Chishuiella changwenlii TaxID=1434701 RepID=A0A1M7DAM4_9FLAO|nr:hypothetical protein [Chishuiella changwenlii]SHL76505.1 hypothetical protein SAMN05443634_1234 [Chishuiella changwenlii]